VAQPSFALGDRSRLRESLPAAELESVAQPRVEAVVEERSHIGECKVWDAKRADRARVAREHGCAPPFLAQDSETPREVAGPPAPDSLLVNDGAASCKTRRTKIDFCDKFATVDSIQAIAVTAQPLERAHHPFGSGLTTVKSGKREKSRSADQSTRTP